MEARIKKVKEALKFFYSNTGSERCGFVYYLDEAKDDCVSETTNIASDPLQGFEIHPQDIINFTEKLNAWATWHTHPDPAYSSNLSTDDYRTFMDWKDLIHFIVGADGVRAFGYDQVRKTVMEIT